MNLIDMTKDSLVNKNLSGHEILNRAKVVGCTTNSEMGLIALAQGKRVNLFDRPKVACKTYTHIYKVLFEQGYPVINDFKRLLSATNSGLIYHATEQPEERIKNFFHYFNKVEHVKPNRPKSLNTRK